MNTGLAGLFLDEQSLYFRIANGFSEFDLWWILNRRMRENAQVDKVAFFRSKDDKPNFCEALNAMNVKVELLDDIDHDREDYYEVFTKSAIEYIREDIASLKGE